jgi:hypothetical protein
MFRKPHFPAHVSVPSITRSSSYPSLVFQSAFQSDSHDQKQIVEKRRNISFEQTRFPPPVATFGCNEMVPPRAGGGKWFYCHTAEGGVRHPLSTPSFCTPCSPLLRKYTQFQRRPEGGDPRVLSGERSKWRETRQTTRLLSTTTSAVNLPYPGPSS